jgi:hypothetical protein
MSKSKSYSWHRSKSNTAFSPMAQAVTVAHTERETNNWMRGQGQLCWKCQKDSIPEKGCDIRMRVGMKIYICKSCVDARKEKV